MVTRITTGISLRPELKEKAEALAKRHQRSLSNLICWVLQKYINEQENNNRLFE